MANWNVLSTDLQSKIVQKLDFITRFRLRHVAKSTQTLVDSTPIFIPRARLIEKNTNFLVVIYTGIEESTSIEFKAHGDTVNVVTRQATPTSRNTVLRKKPSSLPEPPSILSARVFKSIVMHPNTLLGGVEFYTRPSCDDVGFLLTPKQDDDREMKITKIVGDGKIRARILVYSRVCRQWMDRVVVSELREIRTLLKDISNKSRGSFLETYLKDMEFKGKSQYSCDFITQEYYRDVVKNPVKALSRFKGTLENISPNHFIKTENQKGFAPQFDYTEMNSITDCGLLKRQYDKGLIEVKKSRDRCPMRYACRKCADPFEYWFHRVRDDEFTYMELKECYEIERIYPITSSLQNPLAFKVQKLRDGTTTEKIDRMLSAQNMRDAVEDLKNRICGIGSNQVKLIEDMEKNMLRVILAKSELSKCDPLVKLMVVGDTIGRENSKEEMMMMDVDGVMHNWGLLKVLKKAMIEDDVERGKGKEFSTLITFPPAKGSAKGKAQNKQTTGNGKNSGNPENLAEKLVEKKAAASKGIVEPIDKEDNAKESPKIEDSAEIVENTERASCGSDNMIEDEMETPEKEKQVQQFAEEIDGDKKGKDAIPESKLCVMVTISQWIFVVSAVLGAILAAGIAIWAGM